LYDKDERWMVIRRGSFVIVFSLADASVTIALDRILHDRESGDAAYDVPTDLPTGVEALPASVLLSSEGVSYERGFVTLPPDTIAILGPAG
jgi:hypothetical protein